MQMHKDHRLNPHAPIGGLLLRLGIKVASHFIAKKLAERQAKREEEAARRRVSDWPPSAGAAVTA